MEERDAKLTPPGHAVAARGQAGAGTLSAVAPGARDILPNVLERLARRLPVAEPVAVIVAHADDETIGAGAVLPLFRDLLLIHVTDGAPRNLADAQAAGFATAADYAAARARELDAALAAGGVRARRLGLGVADQAASLDMAALARSLAEQLQRHGTRVVLTHPYEGGHPDHDATAFSAHLAALLLARRGGVPPGLVEMACYHAGAEGWSVGCFLPDGSVPAVLALDEAERARKRAMLGCFASQCATLAQFGVEQEAFRAAPRYDFAAPPHRGTLLYERFPWGMDGARWRELAWAARHVLLGAA